MNRKKTVLFATLGIIALAPATLLGIYFLPHKVHSNVVFEQAAASQVLETVEEQAVPLAAPSIKESASKSETVQMTVRVQPVVTRSAAAEEPAAEEPEAEEEIEEIAELGEMQAEEEEEAIEEARQAGSSATNPASPSSSAPDVSRPAETSESSSSYHLIDASDIPAEDKENPVLAEALKFMPDCDIYEK